MSMREEGRTQIQPLIERFREHASVYMRASSNYNETQLRIDFLNPFLQALGWDVLNEKHAPQHLREVVHEDTVHIDDENGPMGKKPDYALRVGSERKFFVEAKKPSVPIATANKPAFQLRRYGWNARMPISVLTNFEKLVIYDCHQRPGLSDSVGVGRLNLYSYTDYLTKFDEIYDLLSREAVYTGMFDKTFQAGQLHSGTEPFDHYFLQQIERWRKSLAVDLTRRNPSLRQSEINFLIQRLIDRIIFLRVCEDRELEKYEALKAITSYNALKQLFVKADKRYNSGLFDFLEDELSLKVVIGSEILVDIFRELYFPESPYAFSVVETNVLSEIYETFLGKEVELGRDGTITIVDKPEIVDASGIIPTPRYIVDTIVERTLAPLCQGKSPQSLSSVRIADIACGSGTFLLAVYEYLLNFHLEWYLKDGAEKHRNEVYEGVSDTWYLTLHEKQRILLNAIYGVDLDIQAVEVTRFSLLLKVLENESAAAIEAHLVKYKMRALPNLAKNIQWGNSLVDSSYLQYDEALLTNQDEFQRINPFDWDQSFPTLMNEGGFDVIVGNPPYIRIQNMVKYSPNEVKYYQSPLSPYTTGKNDGFDKYALFIERSLHLLKAHGRLGYIVPHKFMTIKSGAALRGLITGEDYLSEIVHFGVQQIFGSHTTTYTCILILNKHGAAQFSIEHVSDLNTWRYGKHGRTEIRQASTMTANSWIFIPPQLQSFFKRLQNENPLRLQDVSDIFVGMQTSNDKIYIIRSWTEAQDTVTFTDTSGIARTIEKAILRPCLYKAKLKEFTTAVPNASIIFPYRVVGERAILYSQDEMQSLFPRCWEYLCAYREVLKKRDLQGPAEDTWYRYGRSQSLADFDGKPKLIWSTLTREARYVYDGNNIVYTGGGNGPYYGLKQRSDTLLSLYYIQAILSHSVSETMVKVSASQFRGEYSSHGKQFIANLPIRHIDFGVTWEKVLYEKIVMQVQQLITISDHLTTATLPQEKISLARQGEALKKQIDHGIEVLYKIEPSEITLVKDVDVINEPTDA